MWSWFFHIMAELTGTEPLITDAQLMTRSENVLTADLLRTWLNRRFEEGPRGADWDTTWSEMISLVIFGIIKARHKNSMDEKRLDSSIAQRRHAQQIIERTAWRFRKIIKDQFKILVQNRGEGDKFFKELSKLEKTYLHNPIWGTIDRTEAEYPSLILHQNYLTVHRLSWKYLNKLYPPRVGIGTRSLRPRGPGGRVRGPVQERGSVFDTG